MGMNVASLQRRRALARALHEPRRGARFAALEVSILRYREHAAAIFKKLVELENAGNDNIAPLRRALILCSEQIEGIARLLGVESVPLAPAQEWIDAPTLPRRIRAR
jgi:hypothetical protein